MRDENADPVKAADLAGSQGEMTPRRPLPSVPPATCVRGDAPAASRPRSGETSSAPSGSGFWAALVLSLAGAALVKARLDWSGSSRLMFLLWNLALAWIPYLLSLTAEVLDRRGNGRWWNLGPLGGLFLLFLPNAPYILTDFLHLRVRPGLPFLADAATLSTFALAGWILGLLSVGLWSRRVGSRLGEFAARVFVVGCALSCGYGVYLGRFRRWNSWDLLCSPGRVIRDVVTSATSPMAQPRMVAFTLLFSALVLFSYSVLERFRLGRRPLS